MEHYSLDLPLMVVNREEIQQVVLNLLLNAEHALRGTGRPGIVRVRTGETATGAFVEVTDDGPGVPAPMASQVFEPFFTTRSVGQGTGPGAVGQPRHRRRRTAARSSSGRPTAAPASA